MAAKIAFFIQWRTTFRSKMPKFVPDGIFGTSYGFHRIETRKPEPESRNASIVTLSRYHIFSSGLFILFADVLINIKTLI